MDKEKNYLDSVQQESENLSEIIRSGLAQQDKTIKTVKVMAAKEAEKELAKLE